MLKIKGKSVGEILTALKTKEGRRDFFRNNREMVLYVLFGVGTTIISMGSYALFRIIFPDAESVPRFLDPLYNITRSFGVESSTVLPNILAWFFANLFAFLTNRVFVFRSRMKGAYILLETLKFFASRLFTLLVDILIMFLLVDLTEIHGFWYELFAKVFSNCVVLVLNYILSKLFVFANKEDKAAREITDEIGGNIPEDKEDN